jgi:acetylornithine deacetylase
MKCFFPVVVAALAGIKGADLRAPVTVIATADEESTMAGARALLAERHAFGSCALIGEPTAMVPIYRHKGVMMYRLRITGVSGHSSDPALGRSALEGMHRAVGALITWREAAGERFRDGAFAVPGPTLNLGSIRGGDAPNRICALCELCFDVRTLPAMLGFDIAGELQGAVAGALAGSGLLFQLVPLVGAVPPLATAPGAEIVQAAEALTGHAAGCVAFATEGPFLSALGLETVVLGPGDIAVAHRPDEHVEVARLHAMVDVVRGCVARLCLAPN